MNTPDTKWEKGIDKWVDSKNFDASQDIIANTLSELHLILKDATIHDDVFQSLYSGIHFVPYMEKWLERKLNELYEQGWKDGIESYQEEVEKDQL